MRLRSQPRLQAHQGRLQTEPVLKKKEQTKKVSPTLGALFLVPLLTMVLHSSNLRQPVGPNLWEGKTSHILPSPNTRVLYLQQLSTHFPWMPNGISVGLKPTLHLFLRTGFVSSVSLGINNIQVLAIFMVFYMVSYTRTLLAEAVLDYCNGFLGLMFPPAHALT